MADFDFTVGLEGADAAISGVGRVQNANERASAATVAAANQATAAVRQQSAAVQDFSTRAQRAGQASGQAFTAIGQSISVMGRGTPVIAGLGSAISQLGGATSALSGAFGPLGIAIAGVTVAASALNSAFAAQDAALQAQRARVADLSRSFRDLANAQREAAQNRQEFDRLSRGEGTVEEQRAFSQQSENRAELARRALRGDDGALAELRAAGVTGETRTELTFAERATDLFQTYLGSGTAGGLTSSAAEIRALEAIARSSDREASRRRSLESGAQAGAIEDAQRAAGVAEDRLTLTQARRRGGGGGGRSEEDAIAERYRRIGEAEERERQRLAQERERWDEAEKERRERAEAELQDALDQKRQEGVQREIERAQALRSAMAEAQQAVLDDRRAAAEAMEKWGAASFQSIDQVFAAARELNEELRSLGQTTVSQSEVMGRAMSTVGSQISSTVGTMMVGALDKAVGAWLDGSLSMVEAAEEMAKGVIKSLTQEAIVQTVVSIARSVSAFASQDYAGGIAHLGAAGAWAAVGVAAGSVGLATGAFGGGGQQKTMGGGMDAAGAVGTQQPQQSNREIAINIYPGAYSTDRDVAAAVADAVQTARREGLLAA